jgi:hypothetical protein
METYQDVVTRTTQAAKIQRETSDVNAINTELLYALVELRKELRNHVKFDVKKHYHLMVADACAAKAIDKAKAA